MAEKEIVKKKAVTREPGYLYFVDKEGNVVRVKMKRKVTVKKKEKETQ